VDSVADRPAEGSMALAGFTAGVAVVSMEVAAVDPTVAAGTGN
jgi:hypothetical protein